MLQRSRPIGLLLKNAANGNRCYIGVSARASFLPRWRCCLLKRKLTFDEELATGFSIFLCDCVFISHGFEPVTMGKDQELLEAARTGNLESVKTILSGKLPRTGSGSGGLSGGIKNR